MTPLVLHLPMPPSANKLWRIYKPEKGRPRIIKSAEYRTWLQHAGADILVQRTRGILRTGWPQSLTTPCAVHIEIGKPDRRKRDLDNRIKPILDCLTTAGVLQDDSLVEVIHIEWGAEPGVKVEIWPLAEAREAVARPKLAVVP